MSPSPRYRFDDFILSPRRRTLICRGVEQPLIPRYFDLLRFLIERRGDAVHRRDIFDAVWTDVIVSESALTQAIRTIRRVLGDDPRDPRFVRTVSRHGYQFVFPVVIEDDDDGEGRSVPASAPAASVPAASVDDSDPFPALLVRIGRRPASAGDEEDQRDAAERLHGLGTAEAIRRLPALDAPAFARALLRDTRWDSPGAGPVPILGEPGATRVVWELVRLRVRRAAGIAAVRWASASAGGALAGLLGGAIGGLLLILVPGHTSPPAVVPVLAAIGCACGMVAGAGIGAGMAVAEAAMRSQRVAGLVIGGMAGGGAVGLVIELLGQWTLQVLVGVNVPIGGAVEGAVIGGATALGYAVATAHTHEGLAAPRGPARRRVVMLTALASAGAALGIALAGRPLVGGTIHAIAQAGSGHEALLSPLGRLIGEPGFGPITAALIAMGEGVAFGLGLGWGLTGRR